MNTPIIGRWTGVITADNYEVPRSHYYVTGTVHAGDENRPEETVIIDGNGIRDAYKAVYLLDDGLTVRAHYVAGWQPNTGKVYLHPFPVNPDGRTRPDGRVIDYSTWALGPRRCYHVKVQR